MPGPSRRLLQVLSLAFAAVPFAFATIRVVQTRQDSRYFWVALPALFGTAAIVATGHRSNRPSAAVLLALRVFVVATALAVFAALLLGTRLGPGLLVAASGFGCCYAGASFLHAVARA